MKSNQRERSDVAGSIKSRINQENLLGCSADSDDDFGPPSADNCPNANGDRSNRPMATIQTANGPITVQFLNPHSATVPNSANLVSHLQLALTGMDMGASGGSHSLQKPTTDFHMKLSHI